MTRKGVARRWQGARAGRAIEPRNHNDRGADAVQEVEGNIAGGAMRELLATVLRCRWPKISIRSVHSDRAVRTNRSEKAFARGLRGGIFTGWIPASCRTVFEGRGELPGPVTDQEPEREAQSPRSISRFRICWVVQDPSRVRGHAEDVHLPGADLDDEEAVQALERDGAVGLGEIASEHRGGLRPEELPPCGCRCPVAAPAVSSAA